jgi:nitrate/TMAO reductase-like tetraheme cytochrome c subunit
MTARSAKPRKKSRRKLVLTLVILVPLVLVLLSAATVVTAMQFENHDDFCASCHSEPEQTYFQREAAASTDLASFHSTKDVHCIDCHSGPGLVPGRISALTLGAKDLLAWVSGTGRQPAVHTRHIDDANCLKCHQDVVQRRDFNNHFHIFLSRWQSLDKNAATCISCHQSHHMDGEAQLAFLNRNQTISVCQSCHQALGAGN